MLIQYRMLLAILKHASPILIHSLPILIHWVDFRFSAPYRITLNRHDSSRQPRAPENPRISVANQNRVLRHPIRQPIRIEHPRLSAANQNRVLRHPCRQAIRIEHHRLSAANQNRVLREQYQIVSVFEVEVFLKKKVFDVTDFENPDFDGKFGSKWSRFEPF